MCIGIPMKVLAGAQPPGAYVLAHLGSAMRVLDEEEARLIDEALTGLAEAAMGERFEDRFADLIGREPQLPEHLW